MCRDKNAYARVGTRLQNAGTFEQSHTGKGYGDRGMFETCERAINHELQRINPRVRIPAVQRRLRTSSADTRRTCPGTVNRIAR